MGFPGSKLELREKRVPRQKTEFLCKIRNFCSYLNRMLYTEKTVFFCIRLSKNSTVSTVTTFVKGNLILLYEIV